MSPHPAGEAGRGGAIARQTLVIAAACFMLISAAAVGGAFGGEGVADQQSGALTDQSTLLAPDGPAFAIWSLIYLGLIAYTVWQALPAQRDDARHRSVGGWVALSMALNGLWLVAARWGPLWSTVLVIVLLLAVLSRIIVLLDTAPANGWVETAVVDGANGLHFGWVTIATVANITAWLADTLPGDAGIAEVWAVLVLIVVVVICSASAWVTGRIAPTLASAWGLAWIAVGRFLGEPRSAVVGAVALVVAAVIVMVAITASRRRRRAPRVPAAAQTIAR